MDEVLRRSMDPVLRDLAAAGLALPVVEDADWADDPDMATAMMRSPDGSAIGVSVSRSAAVVDQVVQVADQVQEWAIEELWRRASTNWPPCPHHPDRHPLQASSRDGDAVWACPTDHTPFDPIGGS